MRVVLYAHDMEPITILELSSWAHDFLEKHRTVNLPVYQPASVMALPVGRAPLVAETFWKVCITAEPLHRNGERHMMLFTHDEEQAMLLKSAFLPGQRWALKEIERDAFAKGFLEAFTRLG